MLIFSAFRDMAPGNRCIYFLAIKSTFESRNNNVIFTNNLSVTLKYEQPRYDLSIVISLLWHIGISVFGKPVANNFREKQTIVSRKLK